MSIGNVWGNVPSAHYYCPECKGRTVHKPVNCDTYCVPCLSQRGKKVVMKRGLMRAREKEERREK